MRRRSAAGALPLPAKRKWQTITVGTLLLIPAFWSILAGMVAAANDDTAQVSQPGAYIAFGLCLIPFVFIVVAFMSEHPNAPGAVLKAMGLSVLVGIVVSGLAADAVSGLVAGVGAGGAVGLRPEAGQGLRPRFIGIVVATIYTFVLVRTAPVLAIVPAPIFPLTALGLADNWHELTAVLRPARR
jgi:hypothetical protein